MKDVLDLILVAILYLIGGICLTIIAFHYVIIPLDQWLFP